MIPKLVFAAVAVILTAIVAQPSLAHADPADDYIAELQQRGIDYSTPTAAINLGKASCQALQGGANLMAVIKTIEENEGYSSRDTGIIIRAAANTFCPDQLPTVEGFIENHGGWTPALPLSIGPIPGDRQPGLVLDLRPRQKVAVG